MNRLQRALIILGWQGGTIHQVNNEVQNCLEICDEECEGLGMPNNKFDLLNCSEEMFQYLMDRFSKQYKAWLEQGHENY